MSFFQNPIDAEFRGSMPLDDRQYAPTYAVKGNTNKSNYMLSWVTEPYDFSTYNMLTINFAYDINFVNYSTISINVQGAIPSATMASEVIAALNANAVFSDLFTAQLYTKSGGSSLYPPFQVLITGNQTRMTVRAYITNAGAEQLLHFNAKAPVAQLPSYYVKYTIANRFTCPTPTDAHLVLLDPTDPTVGQPLITAAGFDYSAMLADWQLLAGRSTTFMFTKQTVNGSNQVTAIIEYPAGAVVGDLARKTTLSYTGANTNPNQIAQVPYILTSGDLITP